jgi:hypothetical protein
MLHVVSLFATNTLNKIKSTKLYGPSVRAVSKEPRLNDELLLIWVTLKTGNF